MSRTTSQTNPGEVTAETITDEQIRELNRSIGGDIALATGARWNALADLRGDCAIALGIRRLPGRGQKAAAKARCAAAWNARHAKGHP